MGTAADDDDEDDGQLFEHGTGEDDCSGTDSGHRIGAVAAFVDLAGAAMAAANGSRPWPNRCYYYCCYDYY